MLLIWKPVSIGLAEDWLCWMHRFATSSFVSFNKGPIGSLVLQSRSAYTVYTVDTHRKQTHTQHRRSHIHTHTYTHTHITQRTFSDQVPQADRNCSTWTTRSHWPLQVHWRREILIITINHQGAKGRGLNSLNVPLMFL
jgi:hypothetical protein